MLSTNYQWRHNLNDGAVSRGKRSGRDIVSMQTRVRSMERVQQDT